VTKSGTNRFSGNAFEFLRDHRFNAISPFAVKAPTANRRTTGSNAASSGGTLGGRSSGQAVLLRRLPGTLVRQRPSANIEFVPTASMLAGDFTDFASPAATADVR